MSLIFTLPMQKQCTSVLYNIILKFVWLRYGKTNNYVMLNEFFNPSLV